MCIAARLNLAAGNQLRESHPSASRLKKISSINTNLTEQIKQLTYAALTEHHDQDTSYQIICKTALFCCAFYIFQVPCLTQLMIYMYLDAHHEEFGDQYIFIEHSNSPR